MVKRLRRNFLNGECGLTIDFCVVCAKIMSFMQEVFYFRSHCDINEALRLSQEV
mgnify:CR=1 FL=1